MGRWIAWTIRIAAVVVLGAFIAAPVFILPWDQPGRRIIAAVAFFILALVWVATEKTKAQG